MYVIKYQAAYECHNNQLVGSLYYFSDPLDALSDGYIVKQIRDYIREEDSRVDLLGKPFKIDPDQSNHWKTI